jgi:hypothetical protein
LQRSGDVGADKPERLNNVAVPVANDLDAARVQERGPRLILKDATRMLAAVEFDGELQCGTIEVEIVRSNRVLASKADAELGAAHLVPKHPLRFGHVTPQRARAFRFLRRSREARHE